MDGLPVTWDEDSVRQLLKKYGEIEKIELARNMPSAKRKDFGFITFDTHDAAVSCAKNINNSELGERENKAKVRARLSRPGKGKNNPRSDFNSRHGAARDFRGPWARPLPSRNPRRLPPLIHAVKRPVTYRERRPSIVMPPRGRPVAPVSRSYDSKPLVPSYPKSISKRDYGRREELPPRSRASADYGSRVAPERRASYRDEYYSHGSGYVDLPRGASRPSRRAYVNDGL